VEIKEDAQTTYPDTTHDGPGGSNYDTTGQCVNFKKFEEDGHPAQWCMLYNTQCTSTLREQSDPDCLYYKEIRSEAQAMIEALVQERSSTEENEKRAERLETLKKELIDMINKAAQKCEENRQVKSKGDKKKKKNKNKKKDY